MQKAVISNEQIKEIKISTEMLRFVVIVFLATVSGEISILLKDNHSYAQYILLIIGFLISLGTMFL